MKSTEHVHVKCYLSQEQYDNNKPIIDKLINNFLDEELSKPERKEELTTLGIIPNVGMCAVYRDKGQVYLFNFAPALA